MNPDPDRDDERLEAYLRQFEARAPRPLPGQPRPLVRRPAVAIAALAAMLLIAVSLLTWPGRMKSPGPQQAIQQPAQTPVGDEISFAQLSRIARQEPEKLDSHLDRLSAKLLPDPGGSEGVLNRLSRE
jgi:hypothetical protein